MKSRRVQITLDEEQYERLDRWVRQRGMSLSEGVREAIKLLPPEVDERRAAIAAILSAAPMPVPADPAVLRQELDTAHDRRR